MPQAGVHAIIALYLNRKLSYEKWLYPSVVFGAILPDIDGFMVAFATLFLNVDYPSQIYHRAATHSLFAILLVFLVFKLISELHNKPALSVIGKGIAIGMVSHIIADIFIWFHGIDILWPLPLHLNLWSQVQISGRMTDFLLALEFLFFRIYAWILIELAVQQEPIENIWYIKPLIRWKHIEFWLFIIFTLLIVFEIPGFFTLFGAAYLPSLIIALLSTIMMREVLENINPGNQSIS